MRLLLLKLIGKNCLKEVFLLNMQLILEFGKDNKETYFVIEIKISTFQLTGLLLLLRLINLTVILFMHQESKVQLGPP
jgi:hypothetical protein